MWRTRGSILVLGLLTATALLVIGFGLAGVQATRKRTGDSAILLGKARSLALAGLEDARIKMELDIDFPPGDAVAEPEFVYSETMADGVYVVRVNKEFNVEPYRIVRVWSTGLVGDSADPTATVHYYAEFDTSTVDRLGGGSNPRYFRPIVLQEVTQ